MDKHESDSDHRSPSVDAEKAQHAKHAEHGDGLERFPDPDAGKSEEEKALIVNHPSSLFQIHHDTANHNTTQDKKLVRRLDIKIIPWLTLLYLVSFLDRTNIGNAKVDGLIDDLGMTGVEYNAALSLFFVSYAGFEPLTNILLKRLKPSVFIPAIMVLWGIVMTTMGLVHNAAGLMAARFFLGVAEAGLFPGVAYYLSCGKIS